MIRKLQVPFRGALLGAVLALVAPAAAAADASLLALADTPAWRISRDFVAAYNSGDAQALRVFLASHLSDQALRQVPLEQRVAQLQALRAETGAVDVLEVSGVSHVLVLNTAASRGASGADVVVVASPDASGQLDELQVVRNGTDVAVQEAP